MLFIETSTDVHFPLTMQAFYSKKSINLFESIDYTVINNTI